MHRFRIEGITVGLAASIVGLLSLGASGAQAGAPLPGPNVKIESDSASIDTFQALNSTVTRSRDKSRNDFIGFGENLIPGTLSGPEGKAIAFVSQASIDNGRLIASGCSVSGKTTVCRSARTGSSLG